MKLILVGIALLISFHLVQVYDPVGAQTTRSAPQEGRSPALISVDANGIDALRAKHKGKILVMNFWATWCAPCKEEFPDFNKLYKAYASKGIAVVFVSIDEDDEKTKKQALAFLRRQQAPLPSYIKASGDDEQFINAVHPKWSGAVPATLIYDKSGALVEMKVEETNFEELEKNLQSLLN